MPFPHDRIERNCSCPNPDELRVWRVAVWFSCPLCNARVAIVFLDAPLCGCRRCLDLRYPSQSEGWIERSWRREDAIRRKLIGNDRKRRKGLHRRTINRLMKDALKEEERRSRAAVAFLLHM